MQYNNTKKRSIHGKFDNSYVEVLTTKLFFQYYGHYKLLNCFNLVTFSVTSKFFELINYVCQLLFQM